MKTDYLQRLTPVIRYLEQSYHKDLNLEQVAKIACLSPYHFHRIFKAVTGERLNEYLKRLKLESAANDLFYQKPPVTEVALDCGFSSSQSFAKAFKQYFGLTPSQVRECQRLEEFVALLRNSKIGHTLRKNGHEFESLPHYSSSEPKQRRQMMEIQQFDASQFAYIRVTGPYGENYQPAIEKLYGWAGPNGLADSTSIFVYHDNPEITPSEKCRTDIGLLIPEKVDTHNGVELIAFDGGKYAVLRQTITDPSQYKTAWDELIGEVVENGIETDSRPCFELYHSYDQQTGVSDVSFCTAIK